MAFVELDTSQFPTMGIKRGAPTVSIRENGQIAFSAATAEAIKGCKLVFVRMDPAARLVVVQGVSEAPKGKEKACLNVAWPKKGVGCSFSFIGALRKHFSDYNIVASGNQVLNSDAVKITAEKKLIQFVVPVGALPMREKKVRKPRAAKAAAGVPATPIAKDTVDDDLAV